MVEDAHLTEMSNDELEDFLTPLLKVTELATKSPTTSLPDNFHLADLSVPQLQELLLNMSASNATF